MITCFHEWITSADLIASSLYLYLLHKHTLWQNNRQAEPESASCRVCRGRQPGLNLLGPKSTFIIFIANHTNIYLTFLIFTECTWFRILQLRTNSFKLVLKNCDKKISTESTEHKSETFVQKYFVSPKGYMIIIIVTQTMVIRNMLYLLYMSNKYLQSFNMNALSSLCVCVCLNLMNLQLYLQVRFQPYTLSVPLQLHCNWIKRSTVVVLPLRHTQISLLICETGQKNDDGCVFIASKTFSFDN